MRLSADPHSPAGAARPAASGSAAEGGTAPPSAGESAVRPEPGLARGRWEAPPWFFWCVLAAVVVASTLYLLGRLGVLRFGRRNKDQTPR